MELRNVTTSESQAPAHGRRYGDACGAAFALELIGERWALLIMRELMFGPKRFGAIRAGLPAISARVLAERLRELEAAGVVERGELPPPASVPVYALTAWGHDADEAMLALCRWSLRSPGRDHTLFLSPAAMMMSLRALFLREAAAGLAVSGAIAIGAERFLVAVYEGRFTVARDGGDGGVAADFRLVAPEARPLMALVYGKAPLAAAEAMGLAVAGDREALAAFAACFALPERTGR